MKRAAAFICLIFFFGCEKEKDRSWVSELNGKWELRVTDGGFSYVHKIYPAGNGNTIAFSGTNRYYMVNVSNGKEDTTSGSYTIAHGSTCYSNDITFIRFSNEEPADVSIISVSNDSLYIKVNSCIVADGVDRIYTKLATGK